MRRRASCYGFTARTKGSGVQRRRDKQSMLGHALSAPASSPDRSRDTAPGAEPEDLLRLDIPAFIVPGRDAAHATSAARYLEECLPRSEYWDIPVAEQTETTVAARVMEFLDRASTQ